MLKYGCVDSRESLVTSIHSFVRSFVHSAVTVPDVGEGTAWSVRSGGLIPRQGNSPLNRPKCGSE